MRLSQPRSAHVVALYVTPVVVAWLRLGWPSALVVTLLVAVVGIVLRLRELVVPPDPSLVELHTITWSHYVEKVRWCLDASGIAYRELPSVGILGILLTGRTVPLLALPAARTSIGDSPKILRFLWGNWSGVLPKERLAFLEPTPEALALEGHLDRELGVPLRLWSYRQVLQHRNMTLRLWGIDEAAVPEWQRRLLPIVYPLLVAMLRRMLGIDEQRAIAAQAEYRRVFDEVDALLSDGRRWLLGGDSMSYVDITFASLAALGIFPDGYAGRDARQSMASLDDLTPEWRAEVEALRARPSGRFVLRMYAEERFRR